MPWWAVLIFALYVVVAIGSVRDNFKILYPAWFTLGDALVDLVLVALALSFWLPSLGEPYRSVAPALLAGCVAWLPLSIRQDMRELRKDRSVQGREAYSQGAIGIAIALTVAAPLYWWAFNYAVFRQYAGA